MTYRNTAPNEVALATDSTFYAQMPQVMLAGTFVPRKSQGFLSTFITAQVLGMAFGSWNMYYGTNALPLYEAHQGDALAAGVTKFRIGDINNDVLGTTSRRKLLTGLTPGATYNWQLSLAIVGGSGSDSPVGANPFNAVASPDGRRLWVTNNGDNDVHVINLGGNQGNSFLNQLSMLDSYAGLVSVGAGPQGIAITPDGTKAIVCNASGSSITVINTGDLSVQGTYTVPTKTGGTTPIPARVVCQNNTTAFITDWNNACLHTFTIATGAFPLGVAPLAVGTNPNGIAMTPDGTRMAVCNFGSNSVSILNSPFTAVAVTLAPTANGASPGPREVAAMPNNSAFWVSLFGGSAGGGQRVVQILLPGNTIGAYSEVSSNTGQKGLAIDPDNQSCWVSCANGQVEEYRVSGPYLGDRFVTAALSPASTNCEGMAIDKNGFIYVVDVTNTRVWKYPGSKVICFGSTSQTSAFANEGCYVTYEDA